jgi:thioredoxin-related protein
VDTEETRERNGFSGAGLASRFGVRGTPTVALLRPDGELIDRRSGYLDAQAFLGWLDRSLPEVTPPSATTDLIRTTSP